MNTLLLALFALISTHVLVGMEIEKKSEINASSHTLAQTYCYFTHHLLLPDPTDSSSQFPEIAQQISLFQLRLNGINLKNFLEEIKQSCETPKSFVKYINSLINSCGFLLAYELCEQFFPYDTLSICDIKTCPDTFNNTSLHYAIENKYPAVTQMLLKIAGDKAWTLLSMPNNCGSTALHYAVWEKHTESIKFLLDSAGDKVWILLSQINNCRETALTYAARTNRIEILPLLLDAAGDQVQELLIMQDCMGKTAFDWARPEAREIIQKYMKIDQCHTEAKEVIQKYMKIDFNI